MPKAAPEKRPAARSFDKKILFKERNGVQTLASSSILARPRGGRVLLHQRAGFSISHACTEVSSCGGLNQHYRESKKNGARDLFFACRQEGPATPPPDHGRPDDIRRREALERASSP